jgi:hypothetical protein
MDTDKIFDKLDEWTKEYGALIVVMIMMFVLSSLIVIGWMISLL